MATRQKAKVVGMQAMNANFKKVQTSERAAVVRGITKWCLLVKGKAIPAAPVRLSNLRGSAFIAVAGAQTETQGNFTGDDAGEHSSNHAQVVSQANAESGRRTTRSAVVGAVGFSAVYAASVHELPTAGAAGYDPTKDKKGLTAEKVHSKVGGPKFLINPLEGTRKQGLAILAAEVRKVHK